ncbi:flagellar assembly peptidoglycan hydrolase FlgJ [Brenneria tiliae]|uniref:flagellar assembly peptidoglycan hydrolase FlgJ n=1 Tax=Brenneria tiliae TaxID=2914984 RepID=UPI002014FB57|nr:flagellar assembly peptidoglycan hydrolase FlgJ [Brenneria tiliae]MCL2899824.1 flagellar assembly peptidoglycan hydrolase FlgJ [Brenneria tiliae]MCL2904687.1 flagellar assembly peptidoglycan hydrolase FlgJ [Brenneria tiliae]
MKNVINATEQSSAVYDVNAVNSLRRQVKQNDPAALEKVARQFEGLFVNMMLKSMRSALPQDGMLNNDQTRLFTSMYDQQMAQDLSAKGLGLAEMIIKQLGQQHNDIPADSVGKVAMPLDQERLAVSELPPALIGEFLRREQQRDNADAQQAAQPLRQTSSQFTDRLSIPSMIASLQSGIPHHLIMAQAALESGWGRREITTVDGKPSHNIFGVKASDSWTGKVTEVMTTEFENGRAYKTKELFRVYDSYLDALNDYISLLTKNSRYKPVLEAKSAEDAAYALQRAGYATDPNYGDKLVQIIGQIKQSAQQAVKAYTSDLNSLF